MSTKANDGHIAKALPDEMLFVLMARDITAPEVILKWIELNLYNQPPEKLQEAFSCALKMVATQEDVRMRIKPTKNSSCSYICTCANPHDVPTLEDGYTCSGCAGVRV